MKNILKKLYLLLHFLGFYPKVLFANLKGLKFYYKDFFYLKKQKGKNKLFYFGENRPILNEKFSEAGVMTGHYFHQDLHVARQIFKKNPRKHIDIGSRIDGFVSHIASYREIELIDIRNIKSEVENIRFIQADVMKPLSGLKECYDSISSLHAIEHFGLGRYNDPIDYFGYKKAIDNIALMLKPNGIFYFSVPIGPQRIEFNAHRVFSVHYLMDLLTAVFSIQNFSYVDDNGDFHESVELSDHGVKNNFNCNYGCGIFELEKKLIDNKVATESTT